MLANGRVLVTGGYSGSVWLNLAEVYDPSTDAWTPRFPMSTARYGHTATPLADGRVLVAGGYNGVGVLASAELYNPPTASWIPVAAMSIPRYSHATALLPDGRVLAAGGFSNGVVRTSAEIYDPSTRAWTPTGHLGTRRFAHTLTALMDGRVLAVGGYTGAAATETVEIYDEALGAWSSAAALPGSRVGHAATALLDGRVMVAGGYEDAYAWTRRVHLFDPGTGVWTQGPDMNAGVVLIHRAGRFGHAATRLRDGRVLVAGGYDGYSVSPAFHKSAELHGPAAPGAWTSTGNMRRRMGHAAALLADGQVVVAGGQSAVGLAPQGTADRYDPATGTWAAVGSMATGRIDHTLTRLLDGRVLATGGSTSPSGDTDFLASAEVFDPATNLWTPTNPMTGARSSHMALLLASGDVLVVGGDGAGGALASAELYSPATGTWATVGSLTTARTGHGMVPLAEGRVLVVGGGTARNTSTALKSAEIYDPSTRAWTPTGVMITARFGPEAVLLSDGRVLVAGGANGEDLNLTPAEIYDPVTGTWGATGQTTFTIGGGRAARLPNGHVLRAVGEGTSEIYDPAKGAWTPTARGILNSGIGATMTPLADGRMLVAGGFGPPEFPSAKASAHIFDPAQ